MYLIPQCFSCITFVFCRLEKEHDSARYQLTAELDDKKKVIQSLSKQLEVHQKNFNELKDELAKVGKVCPMING